MSEPEGESNGAEGWIRWGECCLRPRRVVLCDFIREMNGFAFTSSSLVSPCATIFVSLPLATVQPTALGAALNGCNAERPKLRIPYDPP
jgi:hypothetical protein